MPVNAHLAGREVLLESRNRPTRHPCHALSQRKRKRMEGSSAGTGMIRLTRKTPPPRAADRGLGVHLH
jgi:hypothetical protein